jgi:signal transduction histidine kinase
MLWDYISPLIYFCYFPAIVLSALYGDGLTAIFLSVILSQFFGSGWRFHFDWPIDLLRQSIFFIFGMAIREMARTRSRAIEEMKIEKEKLQAVINNVDIGIGVTDPDGKILSLNPAGLLIHGFQKEVDAFWTLNEYIKEFDLTYPDGKPMSVHEWPAFRALRGETVRNYDVRQTRRSDGRTRFVRYSIIPITAAGGRLVYFVFNMVDLTETQRNEQALLAAVRSRDEFLSIASHELKTPITSLKMQVQMRRRSLDKKDMAAFSPEKLDKIFKVDERQIDRLIRLIDDMLDISRISSGKLTIHPELVNICDLVKEAVDRLRPQFDQISCPLIMVNCDAVMGVFDRIRVEQVVANLLMNALKYGGGKPVRVTLESDGQVARLVVEDQGIGISKENQQKIFKRFERGENGATITGLGLGLYIAKQIVEMHHGTIKVESELGQGSKFTVEFPLRGTFVSPRMNPPVDMQSASS